MSKELKNLQEHQTYEEVRREPHMSVIPSLWVINKHTEDGKIDSGKIKARLVVQGNLDGGIQGQAKHETSEPPHNSPQANAQADRQASALNSSSRMCTMMLKKCDGESAPIVIHPNSSKELKDCQKLARSRETRKPEEGTSAV